jgi:hypothetical protein
LVIAIPTTQPQRHLQAAEAEYGLAEEREKAKQNALKPAAHLRHFELLRAGTDKYTLNKQMGNSAAMIERHYSKLTATMAANKLA